VANNGALYRDCAEPIFGLKFKPGGQAATKDDGMMEPATKARNLMVWSFQLGREPATPREDGTRRNWMREI
jgi:hypothetical protein